MQDSTTGSGKNPSPFAEILKKLAQSQREKNQAAQANSRSGGANASNESVERIDAIFRAVASPPESLFKLFARLDLPYKIKEKGEGGKKRIIIDLDDFLEAESRNQLQGSLIQQHYGSGGANFNPGPAAGPDEGSGALSGAARAPQGPSQQVAKAGSERVKRPVERVELGPETTTLENKVIQLTEDQNRYFVENDRYANRNIVRSVINDGEEYDVRKVQG